MREKKESVKGKPLSIKGMSFEEAVAELLRHKPPKEEKSKKAKIRKPVKDKR
jgi:hypothetical protein